jgi:hypothetical protein
LGSPLVADPVILLSFLRCVLVINRSRWLASRERRYNDLTQLGSLHAHRNIKCASENPFIHSSTQQLGPPCSQRPIPIPVSQAHSLLEPPPRRGPKRSSDGPPPRRRSRTSPGSPVSGLPQAPLRHERRRLLAALVHFGDRDPWIVVIMVPKADRREPVCDGVAMEPCESV